MKILSITKYDKFTIYGLMIWVFILMIVALLTFNLYDSETPDKIKEEVILVDTTMNNSIEVEPVKKKKEVVKIKKIKKDSTFLKINDTLSR